MGELVHLVDGRRVWWPPSAPPSIPVEVPEAPPHLSAEERAVWDGLISAMRPVQILAAEHVWFLELFVATWVRWQTLQGTLSNPEAAALQEDTEELVYELLLGLGLPPIVAEKLIQVRALPTADCWWRWIADRHHAEAD